MPSGSDPIELLGEQWRGEVPDIDTAPMVAVARLNRTRALVIKRVEDALAEAGSSMATFDVLSSLRRQGPPYEMKPSAIARSIMLSASGMTNRVDQLEAAGLVARVADPTSRRTAPVALTDDGVAEAERLLRIVVQTEQDALAGLSATERDTLGDLLAKLAATLDEAD
ncbi:MAG: MarR family transcriptional regulator [Actinomycetota bacterium]